VLVVHLGVARAAHAVLVVAAARLAVVDPAGELAHDHEVHALDALAAQRARVGERLEHGRGTQICVEPELLADAQETALGPLVRRERVPFRSAHRAEQDQPALLGACDGRVREGRAFGVDRAAADQALLEPHVGGDLAQHGGGFSRHFRADPVAGKNEHARHDFLPGS
jgi:hypothetical protein